MHIWRQEINSEKESTKFDSASNIPSEEEESPDKLIDSAFGKILDTEVFPEIPENSSQQDYLCEITNLHRVVTANLSLINSKSIYLKKKLHENLEIFGNSRESSFEAEIKAAWEWITSLQKCLEQHMKYAAEYNQVFNHFNILLKN